MSSNDYHFLSHWRVDGTVDEVSTIMQELRALPEWWPAVYLEVAELEPPGPHGVGRLVAVYSTGWLPYTLRWRARVSENLHPYGFTIMASGDFVGRGTWTFEQQGDEVAMTFDWQLRAEKPLIRALSPVLKPAFRANHHWAMARGEESLRLELLRRRSQSDDERLAIPRPPPPTSKAAFALAAVVALAAVAFVRSRASRH